VRAGDCFRQDGYNGSRKAKHPGSRGRDPG
jgi:hypothetical protein